MTELRMRDYWALDARTLRLHDTARLMTFSGRLHSAVPALLPAEVTALECFDARLSWKGRVFADPEPLVHHALFSSF
jgi:hypothetical protein